MTSKLTLQGKIKKVTYIVRKDVDYEVTELNVINKLRGLTGAS